MGIFNSIMSNIFGASPAGAVPPPSVLASATGSAGAAPPTATAPGGKPAVAVDVAANLDAIAKASKEKFDWRSSIVDLMKVLKLDSSLAARKELAQELGYTGNMNDSAAMNIWLHKQVMTKLAENGGKVPEDLTH